MGLKQVDRYNPKRMRGINWMYSKVDGGKMGEDQCSSTVVLRLCELVDVHWLYFIVATDIPVYKSVAQARRRLCSFKSFRSYVISLSIVLV